MILILGVRFAAIDNVKSPEDLVKMTSSSKMEKLIVEYDFDK